MINSIQFISVGQTLNTEPITKTRFLAKTKETQRMKFLIAKESEDDGYTHLTLDIPLRPLAAAYPDTYQYTERKYVQPTVFHAEHHEIEVEGHTYHREVYTKIPNPEIEDWKTVGTDHTHKEYPPYLLLSRTRESMGWFIDIDTLDELITILLLCKADLQFDQDFDLVDNSRPLLILR